MSVVCCKGKFPVPYLGACTRIAALLVRATCCAARGLTPPRRHRWACILGVGVLVLFQFRAALSASQHTTDRQ